ncbi:MAG: NEW3 domain-containing protein, partial [Gammaproteobacteria bacterium]|jgi:hypothetical protein
VVANPATDSRSTRESGKEADEDYVDIEDIRLSPPGCVYHDPELSISPSGAQWTSPGTPVEFTVVVTNTSSTTCDLTSFDLSSAAPPGWIVELDTETLQIAPDWSTGVLDMVITSPAQEKNGSHDITITASNELLSLGASAIVTYVVDDATSTAATQESITAVADTDFLRAVPPAADGTPPVGDADTELPVPDTCALNTPGLSLLPAPPDGDAETSFSYSISLVNNDGSACTDSTFQLSITYLPKGWRGTLSTKQLILSPGNSARSLLAVTPAAGVPAGKYKLQVGVSDALSLEHGKTSTARVSVPATVHEPQPFSSHEGHTYHSAVSAKPQASVTNNP